MKPFSLMLFSRCSLTNGASFWKKGCLSGLAMVPAPLILAYFSQSLEALSATADRGIWSKQGDMESHTWAAYIPGCVAGP